MSRDRSSRTSARTIPADGAHRAPAIRPAAPRPASPGGTHELGQNLLIDRQVIDRVVGLVPDAERPLVEWAAGRGALTLPLARLGRSIEAVEIDPRSVDRLGRIVPGNVTVTRGDILRHAPPAGPYDLVCNVPFHLTTPALRRLFTLQGWQRAVLITQWEVARKRAAVGGATLLTAQWWPWFAPRLDRRIAAAAFRPRPSVDAGLLVIDRRVDPLLPVTRQRDYQRFAAAVFNGRGRGVRDVLARQGIARGDVLRWAREHGVRPSALPRDLDTMAWLGAFALATRPRRAR